MNPWAYTCLFIYVDCCKTLTVLESDKEFKFCRWNLLKLSIYIELDVPRVTLAYLPRYGPYS